MIFSVSDTEILEIQLIAHSQGFGIKKQLNSIILTPPPPPPDAGRQVIDDAKVIKDNKIYWSCTFMKLVAPKGAVFCYRGR